MQKEIDMHEVYRPALKEKGCQSAEQAPRGQQLVIHVSHEYDEARRRSLVICMRLFSTLSGLSCTKNYDADKLQQKARHYHTVASIVSSHTDEELRGEIV